MISRQSNVPIIEAIKHGVWVYKYIAREMATVIGDSSDLNDTSLIKLRVGIEQFCQGVKVRLLHDILEV